MSEAIWVKIATNFYQDEKILLIETLPGGEYASLLWVKLLCLAGKLGQEGEFKMEDRPYSVKMIATLLGAPHEKVEKGINVLIDFNLLTLKNGTISIKNWNKYQGKSKIARAKELGRLRSQRYRDKKKSELDAEEIRHANDRDDVTQNHEKEEEARRKRIEIEKKEKVLEKEKSLHTPSLASISEVSELFSLHFDTTPTHTLSEYVLAKKEYDKSEFARKAFTTMSLLDRHLNRIIAGAYVDFKKSVPHDVIHNVMPQTYTQEEIDSVFRDVKTIDIDNWDI